MKKKFFFDFFDFSIEKIMEASKKFTWQCNHISIIHKISIEKIILGEKWWNVCIFHLGNIAKIGKIQKAAFFQNSSADKQGLVI